MTQYILNTFDLNLSALPRSFGLSRMMKKAWQGVKHLSAIKRQRQALRTMDHTQRRDLGLSQAATLREAARPFWDHI